MTKDVDLVGMPEWKSKLPALNVELDMETLANNDDTVVVSVGAVFWRCADEVLYYTSRYWILDIREQLARGREMTVKTFKWWLEQEEVAKVELAKAITAETAVSVEKFLGEFSDYFNSFEGLEDSAKADSIGLWSRGVGFDVKILGHLYRMYGLKQPWAFRNELDDRTLQRVIGDLGTMSNRHHSQKDAENQAEFNVKRTKLLCRMGDLWNSCVESQQISEKPA